MDVVPESVTDTLKETLNSVEDLSAELSNFLSAAEPGVLACLPPLQRRALSSYSPKASCSLLSTRLRCNGIRPEDHAIRTEFERLSLYEDKLERFNDWNKAPLRPSTTINRQAATRFIGHSLPDLTPEQRQSMREIEGTRGRLSEHRSDPKKRKHWSSEKQSARVAAQEFLEKAARELLGSKNCGMKGPLQNDLSDEEDYDPVC
ncbi:nuclear nucleic acid-binding protein C1D [Iris pallida]|uniref:Nuclear nucleic acid-binding protein C1D n=1 Tax=Iris pallida TaxID=29817 RepID=A0AAX6ILL9_IRIPA|nr:nuclear nucleic acid-binding protein C1D [Iris pallida]